MIGDYDQLRHGIGREISNQENFSTVCGSHCHKMTASMLTVLVLQVFKNCCTYNKPGEDVTVMSQTVEKFYRTKMKSMPQVEAVLSGVGGGGGGAGASAAKKGTPSRTGPGGAGKKVMPSPGDSSSSTDTPTKGQNFLTVLHVTIKRMFIV